MTGIFIRIKKRTKWYTVDIDQLPSKALEEYVSDLTPMEIQRLVAILLQRSRQHDS